MSSRPSPLSIRGSDLRCAFPQLQVLALHGSRARGEAHAGSDWDFAFIADEDLDLPALVEELERLTQSDDIDLADLSRAGGLLRHRVASEGQLLFEREPGAFERFVLDSTRFWLQVAPIVAESQEAVLKGLG